MAHICNDRTSRQRRRAGTTLVLAAAAGGLLGAAMAGSPTARADDPYTDIATYVQGALTTAEGDYTTAATDFSTAGDTNAGLVALFAGFDNTFISPADYTLLGLVAAATDTDYSSSGGLFTIPDGPPAITAAGQEALASGYSSDASTYLTTGTSDISSGDYFGGVANYLLVGEYDVLSSEADSLAALFSAGI
jgi:hypothetical protein